METPLPSIAAVVVAVTIWTDGLLRTHGVKAATAYRIPDTHAIVAITKYTISTDRVALHDADEQQRHEGREWP